MLVGVHASPWMHQLHIHVLSKDLFSRSIERKALNSFATPFLIDLDDFPLTDSRI
jgi:aprataxin